MDISNTAEWCLACRIVSGDVSPVGGFVYADEYWTINHVMPPVHILGYLVLQPRRHVEAMHQFIPEEAASLGQLLARVDYALRQAVGAEKVYVCLFAESAECPHLHFHLIPRESGMTSIGPDIFGYRAPHPYAEEEVASLVQELKQLLS